MSALDPPKAASTRLSPAARMRRGQAGGAQGLGTTTITVKGVRATAEQRDAINEAVSIAQRKNTPTNGILGMLCAGTFESGWKPSAKNPKSTANGVLQALETGLSTEKQVTSWLDGGHGFQGGGGIALARQGLSPGEIAARVEAGETSPSGYAVFLPEARKTLAAFTGGLVGGTTLSTVAGTKVAEPYIYERGTRKGQKENSWEATGRLAEQVNFRRWASLNTLFYVSDEELRAAAAALTIHGDEGWLVSRPTFEEHASGRINTEVAFRVLSERWGVLPGAVVVMASQGAINGRYLVASVLDDLWSPITTVTLRRPVPVRPEPARETRTISVDGVTSGVGASAMVAAGSMRTACQQIDAQKLPYALGGGHPHAGTPSRSIRPGETQIGYDCSGSTGAALAFAGLGGIKVGDPVPGSGSFGQYLVPGAGEEFSIYYNSEHVFVKFADGYELNTGGHLGVSGPRLGVFKHTTVGFAVGHVRGH